MMRRANLEVALAKLAAELAAPFDISYELPDGRLPILRWRLPSFG